MVDIVFSEIDFPSRGAEWKTAMRLAGDLHPPKLSRATAGLSA
ncbi:MAG TPA: hypothetical protein VEQ37_07630 [Actinomycetota bacterium]|nr:hypothetical protein [Actinomycetota bacterium]